MSDPHTPLVYGMRGSLPGDVAAIGRGSLGANRAGRPRVGRPWRYIPAQAWFRAQVKGQIRVRNACERERNLSR